MTERARIYAETEAGKPYVWGGVGPGGSSECGGFLGALRKAGRVARESASKDERAEARAQKIEKYTTELSMHRERVSRAAGLRRAVLVLHAPYLTSGDELTCDGCEYSGYDGEPPPYPCATYRLAMEES